MEPTELLEDPLDEFDRALLRSARVDEPDVHAIARAAVVLGVGTTTLTVAAGSAAASTVPAGSGTVGTFSKLMTFGVVKWLGIGVVSGLMTTSGIELARTATTSSDQREPAASRPASKFAPARPALDVSPILVPLAPADSNAGTEATLAFPPVPAPEPEVANTARPVPRPVAPRSNLPTAATQAAATAVAGTEPSATAVPTATYAPPVTSSVLEGTKVPSIADEIVMLERARRALAAGNAGTALGELDTYERSARARALGTEAAVLRVEALLQAGQRASAVALAQHMLAAQPNGPHANRLRNIVASSP